MDNNRDNEKVHDVDAVVRIFTPIPTLLHVVTKVKVVHPIDNKGMLNMAESVIREAIINAATIGSLEFNHLSIGNKNYVNFGEGYLEQE